MNTVLITSIILQNECYFGSLWYNMRKRNINFDLFNLDFCYKKLFYSDCGIWTHFFAVGFLSVSRLLSSLRWPEQTACSCCLHKRNSMGVLTCPTIWNEPWKFLLRTIDQTISSSFQLSKRVLRIRGSISSLGNLMRTTEMYEVFFIIPVFSHQLYVWPCS